MDNLISVIIPSYKRINTLKEAILSVCNQTYKNFEIIVVNDCGIDTKFVVDEVKEKFPEVNIKYMRHEKNKGLAAARNTGIRHSNGAYIAFLDDDDIYYPTHLEILINSLMQNKNYKVAYTFTKSVEYIYENNKIKEIKEALPYNFPFDKDRLLIENYIPVNAFLIRKEIFTKENLWFDETLKYLEDWDLWIRVSRKYDFLTIPQTTSEIRRLDESISTYKINMYISQFKIFKRYKIDREKQPELYIKREKVKNEFRCLIYLRAKLKKNLDFKKVSVIFPMQNNLKLLKSIIKFFSEKTSYYNKELIVVNSNVVNSNSNKDFLRIAKKLVENKVNIRILFFEKEMNLSQMLNSGVENSTGYYISFLINTLPAMYWLTSMVRFYNKTLDCGLIGGKILTNNFFKVPEELENIIKIFNISDRYQINLNNIEQLKMIFSYILFLKRKDFYKINGFNEKLSNEEAILNFSYKINEIGKKVYYNPFSEGLVINY